MTESTLRPGGPAVTTRTAGPGDAVALADLERDANLVALEHVFDPAEHGYPYEAVLARWRALLDRDDVVVDVVDASSPPGLVALVAHDRRRVRHLAVHPQRWGQGLAGLLLGRAVTRVRAGGEVPVLWCLVENHAARGLYEHRGWTATGAERQGEFAPFPTEMEYRL